jgi:Cell Wall Hydrolase
MSHKGVVAAVVAAPFLVTDPSPIEARPLAPHHHHQRKRHKRAHYRNITKGQPVMLDPEDRDLVIRTVMGEANGEPHLGKQAVAAVIRNRLASGGFGGDTVKGVLFAPKQFEPWSTRRGELMSYGPGSRGWDDAASAVDEAFSGADPTDGATHFANVGTVKERGNNSALGWLASMSGATKIGNHTFGRADGKGDGRVRAIDTGDDSGASSLAALGMGDDDTNALLSEGGAGDDLMAALQSLREPTDDPRRQAVRSLIYEVLDGLDAPDSGQGHAVAPGDGAATEAEEA